MILIDPRAGSGDLFPLFPARTAQLETLPFGDIAFMGNGPHGLGTAFVGIERKRLGDMLQCVSDARFSGHQLPGLVSTFDFPYLLVEGIWRADPGNGLLQWWKGGRWQGAMTGRRGWMARDLELFLFSLELKTPVRVIRTPSEKETVRVAMVLHHWFTSKAWEDHRSHLAIHRKTSGKISATNGDGGKGIWLAKPDYPQRAALSLTDIGEKLSARIVERFPSVDEMTAATVGEWAEVEGIGKVRAAQIFKEYHMRGRGGRG